MLKPLKCFFIRSKTRAYPAPLTLAPPIWLLGACILFGACGSADTPLSADTRQAIDSISAAQIRQARTELDSFCKTERSITLPRLVDSIKQKRLQEIRQQLKTVPK